MRSSAPLFLLLSAFLLSAGVAEARIGASPEECEEFYGYLLAEELDTRVFVRDELIFVCEFDPATGLCDSLAVGTRPKLPLTSLEVRTLLEENSGEGEWEEEPGEERRWAHSSGEWEAFLYQGALAIQRSGETGEDE